MEILVDSSVYINLLRRGVDPRRTLATWAASQRLFGCGTIRVEVLRGCRNSELKADMEEFFDLLMEVETDVALWGETADLAWKLDRQGKVLPITDIFIAACAKRVNATVITEDPHFHQIPGIKVLRAIPAFG